MSWDYGPAPICRLCGNPCDFNPPESDTGVLNASWCCVQCDDVWCIADRYERGDESIPNAGWKIGPHVDERGLTKAQENAILDRIAEDARRA